MTIHLDHTIVPAKDRDASAKLVAKLLGVPCGPASIGAFYEVYLNEHTTLDFQQTDEPFPVYHFCFHVGKEDFDGIVARLEEAGIAFRSSAFGPVDNQVGPFGNIYWNHPEGHAWEILQTSYTRQK